MSAQPTINEDMLSAYARQTSQPCKKYEYYCLLHIRMEYPEDDTYIWNEIPQPIRNEYGFTITQLGFDAIRINKISEKKKKIFCYQFKYRYKVLACDLKTFIKEKERLIEEKYNSEVVLYYDYTISKTVKPICNNCINLRMPSNLLPDFLMITNLNCFIRDMYRLPLTDSEDPNERDFATWLEKFKKYLEELQSYTYIRESQTTVESKYLQKVIDFINANGKAPSGSSNNQHEKALAGWFKKSQNKKKVGKVIDEKYKHLTLFRDENWDKIFETVEKHMIGHEEHKCGDGCRSAIEHDKKLKPMHSWLNKQQKKYRDKIGSMSSEKTGHREKIKKLADKYPCLSISLHINKKDEDWKNKYEDIEAYAKKHTCSDNCKADIKFEKDDSSLYNWLNKQQSNYRSKKASMSSIEHRKKIET